MFESQNQLQIYHVNSYALYKLQHQRINLLFCNFLSLQKLQSITVDFHDYLQLKGLHPFLSIILQPHMKGNPPNNVWLFYHFLLGHLFIQNSPHDEAEYYGPSLVIPLPAPTDNMMQITNAALWALKKIYKKDVYYLKGGVMLMDLVPAGSQQTDLFGYAKQDEKSSNLMSTIDRINSKYSRGTIKLASEGFTKTWGMRRELKSPDYTGTWNEIPTAYC